MARWRALAALAGLTLLAACGRIIPATRIPPVTVPTGTVTTATTALMAGVARGPAIRRLNSRPEMCIRDRHYSGFVSRDNSFYKPIRDAGLATGILQAK